jgi:hypothetical protein
MGWVWRWLEKERRNLEVAYVLWTILGKCSIRIWRERGGRDNEAFKTRVARGMISHQSSLLLVANQNTLGVFTCGKYLNFAKKQRLNCCKMCLLVRGVTFCLKIDFCFPLFWKTGKQKLSAQMKTCIFFNIFSCSLEDPSYPGLYNPPPPQ